MPLRILLMSIIGAAAVASWYAPGIALVIALVALLVLAAQTCGLDTGETLILGAGLAFVCFVLWAVPARADAPPMSRAEIAAWLEGLIDPLYRLKCCDDGDCKPYPAESVLRVDHAGYHLATGEVISHARVTPSPDGRFWRCAQEKTWWGSGVADTEGSALPKIPLGATRCFAAPQGGV